MELTETQATGTMEAAETQVAAEQTGTAAAGTESFINPDGSLKEGWQDSSLIPDDFKGRPVYKGLGNDVASLLKHIGHQDIAISKQGKGIFVPGPEATQTEKDLFAKALGRPDNPDGYNEAIKAAIPKEMAEQYDDLEAIGEAKGVFHEIGLNPGQVQRLIAFDVKRMAAAQEQMKADPMPLYEQILPLIQPIYAKMFKEELQKRWGDSYQSREHLFKRAIVENTKEGEERDLLTVRIEQDPLIADLLATIMNKSFTSGMGPDTSTGSPGGAMNVQQRIESIMKNPVYQNANLGPKEHDRLVQEINRLYSTQTGSKMLE